MNVILLYISCRSRQEGEIIIQHCFEASLIGSATVVPVSDILVNDLMVQDAQECIIVAKTLETHVSLVVEHLQKNNLYYASCLVQIMNGPDKSHVQMLENQLKLA